MAKLPPLIALLDHLLQYKKQYNILNAYLKHSKLYILWINEYKRILIKHLKLKIYYINFNNEKLIKIKIQ